MTLQKKLTTLQKKLTPIVLLLALIAAPAVATSIPSLEGTQPDGQLSVSADGSLLVDGELRLFFDYFLTARGEVSDEALRLAVESSAAEKLPAQAAREAAELFGRYLRFTAIAERKLSGHDPAAFDSTHVERRYRLLSEARDKAFGEDTARRLFGDQLQIERAQLLMQKARLDATTDAAKRASLARFEASLSPAERAARAASMKPLEVRRQVAEMRRMGATDAEVWAVRAEAFGADAADRLAALDARRDARR